ncbi:MAG: hypothetical protein ACOVOQ_07320 [Flavobacterium sp.]
MEKLIVWFTPKDKKIFFNQIHILAESVEEAIKLCKINVKFEHKIMGVGKYREINNSEFINLKMY